MTESNKIGTSTRATAAKSRSRGTTGEQALAREDREAWIASVDVANLDEPGLPAIPCREGMDQRWVRALIGGETDVKNLSAKERRGWRARPGDSLAHGFSNLRLSEGSFAGCIGVHDMVLMERPVEIGDKVREIERKKVNELDNAVKAMQFRETEGNARDDGYFRHESPDLRSKVETGSREVSIPD